MPTKLLRPLVLRSAQHGEPGRRATWLELFFDLAFVAAVAQVGAPLGTEYTAAGLFRYAFLFLLIWWAWIGHTNFSTRFDTDDVIQRLLTLTQIFVVAVMAVNAKEPLDSRSSAGFAAAYAAMRLVLGAQYWRARAIPAAQRFCTVSAAGFGVAGLCWLLSSLVPPPGRFWWWALALAIDLGTPLVTSHLTVHAPPDAEHLPERFGLFTIILLGESMVAVMKGMESQEGWSAAAASAAFLGMAVAFLVWWWYFDGVAAARERAIATPQQARRFLVWTFAHLPLYLGVAVTAVGIEHIIRLAPGDHLHDAEVRILCSAAALFMVSLVVIGRSGERAPGKTGGRPVLQYGAALAPLILPAGHFSPLPLVAAIAGLCLVQLGLASWSRAAGILAPQAIAEPGA